MLEFIGTCNGVSVGKNGKEFCTFFVAGLVGTISVAKDYAMGAEPGRRYIIRCVPRKYENNVFLTFSVVSEV